MMPNLDPEETSLLESFEQGEWVSDYSKERLNELQFAVGETLANNQKITVDISKIDLEFLQVKAIEEGIPYQLLISSLLHKYVTGKLVEKL